MYDAFKISVALDKLNIKIESLYAYDQKLFIGTSTGSLFVYEVKESLDEEKPLSVNLIETRKNFSKRSIEQLNVIKEIDVLVALSDSCISIYDLHTLSLQKQLAKTRGANLFAIDTIEVSPDDDDNGIPTIVTRLSVAEISIPDRIRTMVSVSSTTFCLGLANEYALLDISSGVLRELFSPSSTPINAGFSYMVVSFSAKVSKPLITKLPNDEILLAKDNVSIFVGLDGTPTRKVGIDWSGTPEEIGYSYPYLVAILPKHVEIRNIVTQSLVQTIELPQPRLINQGESLCIANNNTVWRFIPINFENQIDQLVEKHEYQEAISLTEQIEPLHLENKDAKLYQIRDLYAHHLFQLKNFDAAMTIFQDLETNPAEVIALYSSFTSNFLHHKSEEDDDENKFNEKNNITPQTEDENDPIDKRVLNGTEENKILEGKELKNAISALIRFLTDRRQRISKILHHQQVHKPNDEKPLDSQSFDRTSLTNGNLDHILELAEIVDTALLKAYMMTNDALVGPLLRVHNHVNVEETEGILLERKVLKN
ncbi:3604_t:CDS:10 [Entrophospora sp. SA101]|nr:10471_t:CDS:10 [Entrophospora sp. SA101]CAJ0866300.1 3604_t:CDS:10 [Entrophospora sp. SA101]